MQTAKGLTLSGFLLLLLSQLECKLIFTTYLTESSNLFFGFSVILKVHFSPTNNTVMLHAEISGINVVGIRMDHDWLLSIREYNNSSDDSMDLFHIPSRATVHL